MPADASHRTEPAVTILSAAVTAGSPGACLQPQVRRIIAGYRPPKAMLELLDAPSTTGSAPTGCWSTVTMPRCYPATHQACSRIWRSRRLP